LDTLPRSGSEQDPAIGTNTAIHTKTLVFITDSTPQNNMDRISGFAIL